MREPAAEARSFLERLLGGRSLTEAEADRLLVGLTDPAFPPALAASLLTALRAKGETPEEVRGFAMALRRLARRPEIPAAGDAVDVVGTGGDDSGSFNLSTGSALLVAACGQAVIKHGNRSVSSRSGSADVLERLGVALPADGVAARSCLERTGFTFLFAPHFHPAMKSIAPVRRAMGVRTVFNLLGPLVNPARPGFAVIGAYSPATAELLARCLAGMPIERAFVVHGAPGWDEATPVGPFLQFDVRHGRVDRTERDPAEHGVPRCSPGQLAGGDATVNARALRAALGGEPGPHRDALTLGAGLALEVAGACGDLSAGVIAAGAAIDDGRARRLLERLVADGAET